MNRIVKILMDRDDMTEEEARDLMNDVRSEMDNAIECGDYSLAEEIFESDLGLEPDYIMDIMF